MAKTKISSWLKEKYSTTSKWYMADCLSDEQNYIDWQYKKDTLQVCIGLRF